MATVSPWPSTIADQRYEWEPITCADCGTVIAFVASFDSAKIGPARCPHCEAWHAMRCARCRQPLATTGERSAVVVYCAGCMQRDTAARERREQGMELRTPIRPDPSPGGEW